MVLQEREFNHPITIILISQTLMSPAFQLKQLMMLLQTVIIIGVLETAGSAFSATAYQLDGGTEDTYEFSLSESLI